MHFSDFNVMDLSRNWLMTTLNVQYYVVVN